MALSTDINLPKDYKARFPDKCVVCSCDNPNSSVRLITGSVGWWSWLFWFFGMPFTVKAPACMMCAWYLHLLRFISLLITVALIAACFWWVWPWIDQLGVHRKLQKWIMMGAAIVAILPQIAFEIFFPHPFSITAFGESVDYEFRDEDLAIEFAELNEDAEWVKIT